MEYRDKKYTIASVGLDSWRWTVQLDGRQAKSGLSPTREAAVTSVIWAIDVALQTKKPRKTLPT